MENNYFSFPCSKIVCRIRNTSMQLLSKYKNKIIWHSHFSPHLLSHSQSLKILFQFLMKVFVIWIIYYCRINNSHFKGYLLPAIVFLLQFTVLYKSSIHSLLKILFFYCCCFFFLQNISHIFSSLLFDASYFLFSRYFEKRNLQF